MDLRSTRASGPPGLLWPEAKGQAASLAWLRSHPCTVRTVTGHIPGAGGRRRGRPHAIGRRDQRPQTTGDRRLVRPQATGRRSSRPAATHRPGPEATSTRVRLRRPPLRPRRQHVSDRRRRGWWKRKLGRGSRCRVRPGLTAAEPTRAALSRGGWPAQRIGGLAPGDYPPHHGGRNADHRRLSPRYHLVSQRSQRDHRRETQQGQHAERDPAGPRRPQAHVTAYPHDPPLLRQVPTRHLANRRATGTVLPFRQRARPGPIRSTSRRRPISQLARPGQPEFRAPLTEVQ
jgi:hypothetical protein